nr:MAG TPA: hypothetical protein [Caudoviricetes sp.]
MLSSLRIIHDKLRNCKFLCKKLKEKVITSDDYFFSLRLCFEKIFSASSGDIFN